DSVDLGGFRQYVHRRDAGLKLEWAVEISKDSFTDRLNELLPEAKSVLTGLTIGLSKFDTAFLDDLGNVSLKEIYEALIVYAKEKSDHAAIERLKEKKEQNDFVTVIEKSLLEGEVHIETFWIDIGEKRLLSMSYRHGNYLQLDSLDTDHTDFQKIITFVVQAMTTTDKVESTDMDALSKTIDELVPKISFEMEKFFPGKLRREEPQSEISKQPPLIPISKGSKREDLQNAIQIFLPRILQDIVLGFCQIAEKEINRLTYLGPLRSYPPRHIAFSQFHDPNWQAGGGHAWDVARKDHKIRSMVNDWLGAIGKLSTHYDLRVRNLLTIEDIKSKHYDLAEKIISDVRTEWADEEITDLFGELESKINELPQKLEVWEPLLSDMQELVLFDKRTNTQVSHRDVGIGISQVLPVLVTAFASSKNIIAIEQPEIHLHPALQAELGDVFIESALGENKNTFIIETHSEHLILRIIRRMRETAEGGLKEGSPVTPNDVCILYVDQPKVKNYSVVYEMRLDKDGTFLDPWPGGFFEEGFKERFL
ncbi:MAG: AAA family ATPase, partial [Desulfobacteraceae bacterium]|nr:AAA family ATPase [Desulfobacteraceae bacterium]